MKGILGRKVGMTQVFSTDGKLIPVTVVYVEPNVVTQIKTKETDGYDAIQLGAFDKKKKASNKPEMGHVKKSKTEPKRFFNELRGVDVTTYTLGQVLDASVFESGDTVDVTGTSKGKGFQGVIKRHNQHRGPMTHGSHYHRGPCSMGTMLPKRVLKGKKLPGHMGNEKVTIQNLQIVDVDLENNYILVKGNIPGPKQSLVLIREAIKGNDKKETFELVSYETVEEVVENTEEVETTEETVAESAETEAVETAEEATETSEEESKDE